jgi:hypothetical protein
MLPDLWRMADRQVRPALVPVAETRVARVNEVLTGIAHHTRADAAFHASASFHEGERALARAFADLGAARLPLFGHIAWELCLDGALLRREGESLLADLRAAIAVAMESVGGETAVAAAARVHRAARKPGAPLPTGFEERVARILTTIGGEWIEGYTRGAVVGERLEGIRAMLGLARFTTVEREALGGVLEAAIARAARELDALLAMEI